MVRHQTLTLTCVSSNLTEAAIIFDLLAQSVEHLTFNQRVSGSNPERDTIFKYELGIPSFYFVIYLS